MNILYTAAATATSGREGRVKSDDGTWWAALYQVCVHLGCKVPFRDDCVSFKCPCHGSHYNVDGEYLDGPAPRSLDRFVMTLTDDLVRVDTGKLNQTVQRPDSGTRIRVAEVIERRFLAWRRARCRSGYRPAYPACSRSY